MTRQVLSMSRIPATGNVLRASVKEPFGCLWS